MPFGANVPFEFLRGKTLTSIDGATQGSDEIVFTCDDGASYRMYHSQNCCETVDVAEVIGDVADLIGSPIVEADESYHAGETSDGESSTWTFYRLGTALGFVTLRWLGRSNGYYSEHVDFEQMSAPMGQRDGFCEPEDL